MFKIEIPQGAGLTVRNVTSKKGQEFTFKEQPCYVHLAGEQYPLKSRLTLPKGQEEAYAPGMYRTSDDSVRVNPFGEITVKLSRLLPLPKG